MGEELDVYGVFKALFSTQYQKLIDNTTQDFMHKKPLKRFYSDPNTNPSPSTKQLNEAPFRHLQ